MRSRVSSEPAEATQSAMTDPASSGFFEGVFDRTLTNLRSAWRDIAESAREVLAGAPKPDASGHDPDRVRPQLLSCLDGRGGEVTAHARAVDLRAELIDLGQRDPTLMGLEQDFKLLLANWFDIGFLELKRITWESPAALLEKLMAYEAVHEIRGWTDLKNRLEADRRCFAFFHPRMPEEPLIFVEVALVTGMASDIHALLDEAAPITDPHLADSAIFYSISNCQRGLAGISFGDFLIKRVVDALATELPRLKIFATLSPVPGFRAWLKRQDRSAPGDLLLPAERTAIEALGEEVPGGDLLALIDQEGWHNDPRIAGALREPLLRLC